MPGRIALLLLFGLSLVVESRQSDDFVFALPDLAVVQHGPLREFQLEAFRAAQNEHILRGSGGSSAGQLSWVSLGDPQLVASKGSGNQTRIITFQADSVEVQVTLLKESMRELLARAAREKHAVAVSPHQILTVPLSHARCILPLQADDGTRLALTGKAANLQENPLRVVFDAPRSSVERAILERRMRQARSNEQARLAVSCTFSALGKLQRVSTLTLSVSQMHQLGLQEKLLGPAEERFVSRKQMAALASDLYSRLDVVAEYEMPQHEFIEKFIRDFIQQAAATDFGHVAVDDALRAMSPYATQFGDDLNADEVVRDMGRVFRIDRVGNKSHVVVDTDKKTEGRGHNHTSSRDARAFYDMYNVANAQAFVGDMSRHWLDASTPLDEQLRELNVHARNDVEWAVDGHKVIPKKINVARLSRGKLSDTLHFGRVRKEVRDASFSREFLFHTDAAEEQEPSAVEHIMKTLAALERENAFLKEETKGLKQEAKVLSRRVQSAQDGVQRLDSTLNSKAELCPLVAAAAPNLRLQCGKLTAVDEDRVLIKQWEGTKFEEWKKGEDWKNTSTLLHYASEQGQVQLVQALLARGDDVDATSEKGYTPLYVASAVGKTVVVTLLIQNGAKVSQPIKDNDGWTPLHSASFNGNAETVEVLIKTGANVNEKTDKEVYPLAAGSTALHMASSAGHPATAEVLIKSGANVNEKNNVGDTALHMASWMGHAGTAELLIQEGANVNAKTDKEYDPFPAGSTPLHMASREGKVEAAQVLIEAAANMNENDSAGDTPLHLASSMGHAETAEVLIEAEADVDGSANNGETPLHKASAVGHTAIVESLIEAGANVNATESNGETPLHKASSAGYTEVVRVLLLNKADKNIKSKSGKTPRGIVCEGTSIRKSEASAIRQLLDQ